MKHILLSLFILVYSGMALSLEKSPCEDAVGSCDYYKCREEVHNCGKRKYFIKLGYKYCKKYLDQTYYKVSTEAQEFLDRNAVCLQSYLEDMEGGYDMSCSELKKEAIDSHAYCYYKSGYCDLIEKDQDRILRAAFKRWLLPSSISEAIKLHKYCKYRPNTDSKSYSVKFETENESTY